MKPLIGIVEWPYPDKDNDEMFEVSMNVINKVIEAGGTPIGIFPTKSEKYLSKKNNEIESFSADESHELLSVLDKVDAVIKPGALRIYDYEKLIHRYTLEKNIPYLGICAGMQIMAHSKNIPVEGHSNVKHNVKIKSYTLLESILGKNEIEVISKHRYCISDKGDNQISALADDGTIEAIENPNCSFNLGVQWHPELDDSESTKNIFGALTEYAKVYRKRK